MDGAKERHAQLGVFVLRLFPTIVQFILKDHITPGTLKRMYLNHTLNTKLTVTDIGLMKMLPNMDDFTIEICYKILRFENLIGEPKCKWGNIPHETEIAIADDIQRILNASNEVITKSSEEITKMFRDSYVDNVKRITGRVDAYLNGNTCQQSYQNLHIQKISVSELLQILEEVILKHPIKVIPSIMTTAGTTMMRELYSRIAIVVTEIFPDILRDILQSTISPQDMYKKCDKKFLSSCFSDQQTYLKTLKLKQSFSFLDIPIIYKLFRYFSLISPPSKGWGKDPDPTDNLIADDIERIRTLRNKIAHRCDAKIDKNTCDAFFVRFCEICERIDVYFTGKTNYEQRVIECRMCPLDIQMQTRYENAVKELENLKLHYESKPVKYYWGDTFEKNLMNLRTMIKQEKLEGNDKLRVQIVFQTESDMNDIPVSILNSLRDEINQGLNGINFVCASSGSIVLCVDILVDEMQTDEKMQLVLYSFINTILETKIISVSSAGYVDVVLIYSEENTFFEMTKKETVTSSVVNLDFDIDARHFETDEQMKAALIDIVDNVYKKSNGSGTTGEIKATVMPLEFDFAEELKEYDKSTQENTDTRHDLDHFDTDIEYEKKDQGNADLCDYSEEQVTYAQVAKEHMKGQVIQVFITYTAYFNSYNYLKSIFDI
ncbi:uncharacterized protein LOC143059415 [Mytilus galloprovincialis]|uniref:uncharacterized protein LOC143059415 n=1 Tax=Mytilus galloprovincialis TaxID=29158 RepID=UPI003F7BDA63